jgi:hypothetical protein
LIERLGYIFVPGKRKINCFIFLLGMSVAYSLSLFILQMPIIAIEALTSILLALIFGADLYAIIVLSVAPSAIFLFLSSLTQILTGKIESEYLLTNFIRVLGLTSFSTFYIKVVDVPSVVMFLSKISKNMALIAAITLKQIYEGSWLLSELSLLENINTPFNQERRITNIFIKFISLVRGILLNLVNDLVFSSEAVLTFFPKILKEDDANEH